MSIPYDMMFNWLWRRDRSAYSGFASLSINPACTTPNLIFVPSVFSTTPCDSIEPMLETPKTLKCVNQQGGTWFSLQFPHVGACSNERVKSCANPLGTTSFLKSCVSHSPGVPWLIDTPQCIKYTWTLVHLAWRTKYLFTHAFIIQILDLFYIFYNCIRFVYCIVFIWRILIAAICLNGTAFILLCFNTNCFPL